jgi:hypothetical protein
MSSNNIDDLIVKSQKRTAQLKQQKKERDIRERKQKEVITTRRKIIIGGIIEGYFPEVLKLQPQRTDAENEVEFALLEMVISLMAQDQDYIARLKEQANDRLKINVNMNMNI